jgi:hypothetical protein
MRCPPDERLEIAMDWANSWRKEAVQDIYRLSSALDRADIPDARIIAREMRESANRRFPALVKVLETLWEVDHADTAP